MIDALLNNPRYRSLLAVAFVLLASVLAGQAIYSGHPRFLAILALFTMVVLLRRSAFTDFYLLTLVCLALSHVKIGFVKSEFEIDKWRALFGMALLSLGMAVFRIHRPQLPSLIHLLVLAEVLLASYSVYWSNHPWLTFQKAGVYVAGMIVAFIGAWCYVTDVRTLRQVVDVHVDWLWLVFPVSMLVMVLPYPGKYSAGRFLSIFENANNLGCWASLSLPLLFGLALTHPVRWRRRVALLMLVTGFACVFQAGSRGGMLGALGGMTFYCLMRWPRRTLGFAAAGSVVVLFLYLYQVDFSGISRHVEHLVRADTLSTLSDRTVSWRAARLMGAQRPWFGHGFGLSDQLFWDYGYQSFPGSTDPTLSSTYLEAYCMIGRIGLGLLLAVQAFAAWIGFRTWWRDRNGPTGLLALAILATVVSASAHGIVEEIYFSMGNPWSLPYWVSLALLAKFGPITAAARSAPVQPIAAPVPVAVST